MQRSLRIALTVAAAAGAVALGAGTALAAEDGPVIVEQTETGENATHGVENPNVELPEVGGALGGALPK